MDSSPLRGKQLGKSDPDHDLENPFNINSAYAMSIETDRGSTGTRKLSLTSVLVLSAIVLSWGFVMLFYSKFTFAFPFFFLPFGVLLYRSEQVEGIRLDDTIRSFGLAFACAPILLLLLIIFLLILAPVVNQTSSIFTTLWIVLLLQVSGKFLPIIATRF
uniref:Uncharacterized protein n=1 Tax=Spongospora subterranea TaxID=70186 RepID=A0A0H5R5I3_9EUKA|eukprot:CRZ03434.1 hypothetical protein [Spongospora subterranea]